MAIARNGSGRGGARPGAGRERGQVAASMVNITAAAQGYGELALQALMDVAMDKAQPAAARISAAYAILDRGFGKPTGTVEHAQEDTLAAALREIQQRRSMTPISER